MTIFFKCEESLKFVSNCNCLPFERGSNEYFSAEKFQYFFHTNFHFIYKTVLLPKTIFKFKKIIDLFWQFLLDWNYNLWDLRCQFQNVFSVWDHPFWTSANFHDFNSANLILICIMRKVWYNQIWIQNNLGFMVLILIY